MRPLLPAFSAPNGYGFAVVALCLSLLVFLPQVSAAERTDDQKSHSCAVQKPQKFLIRSSFIQHGTLDAAAHERAVRYRAEQYGSVDGMNLERFNPRKAYASARLVHFMGLPVQVHERIAGPLSCVESYLRRTCTLPKERYTPRALSGFRKNNTYRGAEISNHLFGIALDIDPGRNPCCGCVRPWPDNPACKSRKTSVYDRAALPRCWIDGFERYGFYWLGRDPDLRDTMHFEFLGEPEPAKEH